MPLTGCFSHAFINQSEALWSYVISMGYVGEVLGRVFGTGRFSRPDRTLVHVILWTLTIDCLQFQLSSTIFELLSIVLYCIFL